MPILNPSSTREFLDRFYSFHDALLRKIEIAYTQDGGRIVTVWIATRDGSEAASNGWVCVRLVISGAKDFCFSDAANTTNAVISNGVYVSWFGAVVGLDFGHFANPPGDLNELKSSKCFVTGSSVDWTIEAY
jgi:hypothetical protein